MKPVIEKFLRYVKIDTQSQESDCVPSTDKQRDLARLLVKELHEMGASDVRFDEEHCYVYATIPSNLPEGKKAPVIGFIAHMDTSPAVSGAEVKPRIVEYQGGDIVLNEEKQIVLSVQDNPELSRFAGKSLIVTDGTTLLGADDKAGVAEIMAFAEYALTHPDFAHGTIRIGFTPDEEVGRGVDFFDVEGFGADFAYTVDGGDLGELEYENFNAAGAKLVVHGRSVHPGSAKNKMLNAILLAQEFQSLLPIHEDPASTEGYEGFYHLEGVSATVDHATARYIVRDHDAAKFQQKLDLIDAAASMLNQRLGEERVTVEIKQQYRNMAEIVRDYPELIDVAKEAYLACGVEPQVLPIRGGTDGAQLSFRGLPCPNLSTGGYCYHGVNEFVPVSSLVKMTDVLQELVARFA